MQSHVSRQFSSHGLRWHDDLPGRRALNCPPTRFGPAVRSAAVSLGPAPWARLPASSPSTGEARP